jgi:hypothetical protein
MPHPSETQDQALTRYAAGPDQVTAAIHGLDDTQLDLTLTAD